MKSKKLIYASIAFFSIALLSDCSSNKDGKVRDFEDLSDKKIVVQEGTTFDEIFKEKYPSYNVTRVPTFFDIYKKLVSGEADYGIDEDVTATSVLAGGLSIDTTYANTPAVPMGAIFNKSNTELLEEFNEFITDLDNSGKLNEIRQKWFSTAMPSSLPVPEAQTTTGTPLTVVMEGDYPPFNLMVGDKISGFEVELVTLFADKIQRPVKFKRINFVDIIPYISKGKADMSLSGFSITEERAKIINFSKPYNNTYTLVVSLRKGK